MRTFRLIALAALPILATPAAAGETPLYRPAPAWVEQADASAVAARSAGPVVLFDRQEWIEGDTVSTYVDSALRLDTPQALTQFGTLGAAWLPDKGDLVIHRAELLRDGAAIDLLKNGATFSVLRREQHLEQRALDGMLTATMPVAGARLGDILRLAYTVTSADAALGGNVQRIDPLPARPFEAGLGRLQVSWPAARRLSFRGMPALTLPEPSERGGVKRISIALPLAKPAEMPEDSPARYRVAPQLQMSSFGSWEEVSRTFAKLFVSDGALAADKGLAGEAARIAAASPDPVERMSQALRLVQDRISYLANGMNGGNYVPQSPAQTWSARYGDCKAKTLLLLALLREMGIEADAVLVNATLGDAVSESLPMAAAFDHVVVRARSGGRDYWLDGTVVGTRRADIGVLPNFRFGLPLTAAGSPLVAIAAQAPATPLILVRTTLDQRAGIDFPALFDTALTVSGPLAAQLQPLAGLPPSAQSDELIDGLIVAVMGESQVLERKLTFDAAQGTATVTARGLQTMAWNREQRRALYSPRLPSAAFEFAPDRGRAAWKAIPVELGAPERGRLELTVLLPEDGRGVTVEGSSVHASVARRRIDREARIEGGKLIVVDDDASDGGELPASEIAAERSKMSAFKASALRLRAPADAARSWQVATPEARRKLKPVEQAYARLIADHPDTAENYLNRASYLSGIGDFRGALKDLDKALSLDAASVTYDRRATAHETLGDVAAALADMRKAQEIAPEPWRAGEIGRLMGEVGEANAGLELVAEALANPGEDRTSLVEAQAELLARLGRKGEGLEALTALLADRPGDVTVLNALCWYRGVWNHAIDGALADCNRAVEGSSWTPPILDSRALAQFRLGKLDAALTDANAALEQAGGQTPTLLLRGIIRKAAGEAAGEADIAEALRRRPGLKRVYQGYGLLP